jgi:hypothetical protein
VIAAIFALAAVAPAPASCEVLDYGSWHESAAESWDFRWPSAGDPQLTIIGAEHVRDPAHPQFPKIAAAFAAANPTLVFFEGPDRGVRADAETTIRETGESGYARFLASQAGLETRSLEPSPADQLRTLSAVFPPDQVLLFFTLREAARLRDREHKSGAALDAAIAVLLTKAAAFAGPLGGALPFRDVPGLSAAARSYWPNRDWRSLPGDWFSPTADDAKTGGLFLGAINRADSTNRNRHMVAMLAAAVKSGARPFVVVGRNHVPMQAPALRCALRS